MTATTGRAPPAGFTRAEWDEFEDQGILILPGRIPDVDVVRYREAALATRRENPGHDPAHTWKIDKAVARHPCLAELIDHDRHIGYAYDLYGDQLTLTQADLVIRPNDNRATRWHIDGPLAVPYRVFAPTLPLKLRVGYWLTDVLEENMGNLVYVPGSHRADYPYEHAGNNDVPTQKVITCKAGTITLMHVSLWHRVMPNLSDAVRYNIYLSYVPSWCTRYYRYEPSFEKGLSRTQKLILRNSGPEKTLSRPEASDLPLFADPAARLGAHLDKEPHKVRRFTRLETMLGRDRLVRC